MAGFHFGLGQRVPRGGGLVCGNPPPGWIYINDEIPGGLVSMAFMTCLSSYNCEAVVNVGDPELSRIDYSNINGLVDISQIQSDWPGVTGFRFYNQLDYSSSIQGGDPSGWNGSKGGLGGGYVSLLPSTANTNPHTVVMVLEDMDLDLGDSYTMFNRSNNIRLQYLTNSLIYQLNGGTFTRKTYTGTRVAGTKLLVATYDGSQARTGLNLYINDMVTPLVGVDGGSSATVGAATFGAAVFATNDTSKQAMMIFPSELDATQRATVKTFFEQKYTFS